MAIGVPETDVFQAADRVLARGTRPTVERVRTELGRGSPARVGQLLEQWWDALAKRLAGETRLPELPADVASAFTRVWAEASEHASTTAEQSVAAMREALPSEQAALAAERAQWVADLERARAVASAAHDGQTIAQQRLADLQRRAEQLLTQLHDVSDQRDKLEAHAGHLAQEFMRLGEKLEAQEKAHAAERASAAAHIRSTEDRAHAEVDRAREDIKGLRTALTQLERTGQAARDAAAREHKEHAEQLRIAEREASAHRARADALHDQLQRLGSTIQSLATETPSGRSKKRAAAGDRSANALSARMQTAEHKAGVNALSAATPQKLQAAVAKRARRKPQ